MIEDVFHKLKRTLKYYISKIAGKKYGCCDKWFVSCKKCLKVDNLIQYEQERLKEIYKEVKKNERF